MLNYVQLEYGYRMILYVMHIPLYRGYMPDTLPSCPRVFCMEDPSLP